MDASGIIDRVRDRLADAVVETSGVDAADPWIRVEPSRLPDVAAFLKDELDFDFLMSVTGMDTLGLHEGEEVAPIRVLYHLFSYTHKHTMVLKVDLQRDEPVVGSLAGLYPAALWNEREVFDLLGVVFDGHPDLRRILLPQEWEGHPLRRDWKEGPTALGFDTGRTGLLDLIKDGAGDSGKT